MAIQADDAFVNRSRSALPAQEALPWLARKKKQRLPNLGDCRK